MVDDRPIPEAMLRVYPDLEWSEKAFVDDFIAHQFAQRVDKAAGTGYYKLTNAIAENLLSKSAIEGIMYPTIAMNELNHNLVMKFYVVDERLELVHAQWVKFWLLILAQSMAVSFVIGSYLLVSG